MPFRRAFYVTASSLAYPLFNAKVGTVHGTEHLPTSGGYIIAINHVDWLDGFYVAAAVHQARRHVTHFLTASNNYWWTTIAVQIPQDRSAIIDTAVQQLRRGKVICNFPEGARNDSPQLLPGKTGTVRMASLAGVPVVPAGITCDAGRNMGQSLQFLLSSRHPVRLQFGAPIMFHRPDDAPESEWLEQSTEHLMRAIVPLCNKTV
jgi:1-acyl-sn-glycerol-3-phosphate acyltransferase